MITWDGGSYEPNGFDELWLLRAVEGEGGNPDRVAQTLVNRFAFLASTRPGLYPTLAELVQAYSQPVNPKWMEGGTLYEEAWRNANQTERAELFAASERRKRHRERDTFSQETTAAVRKALREGPDAIGPSWVHFRRSSPAVPAGMIATTPHTPGFNRFFAAFGSLRWGGYSVEKKKRMELCPTCQRPLKP